MKITKKPCKRCRNCESLVTREYHKRTGKVFMKYGCKYGDEEINQRTCRWFKEKNDDDNES